jgi:HupF/HypC family
MTAQPATPRPATQQAVTQQAVTQQAVTQQAVTQPGAAQFPAAQPLNQCLDDVCVTCSDMAVPVTVVRLLGNDLAVVDTGAGEEEVSVAFVAAAVGDTVLVHAGEAIAVVSR